VLIRFRDKEFQATGSGDGGYDAFMQALKTVEKQLGFTLPKLLDYEVRIPPGGKTDALVETTIKWEGGMKTRGVHSDQLAAAIQATEHALNMIALRSKPSSVPAGVTKQGRTHGPADHKKIVNARRR
jgi:(R)-citramalate synthase